MRIAKGQHSLDVSEGDVLRVQPGPRYAKVVLAFEGASGIDPDQLDAGHAYVGREHPDRVRTPAHACEDV